MTRLLLFLLCGCCFPAFGQSQEKPDYFPEDIDTDALPLKCYCQPGVRNKSRTRGLEIAYTMRGGGTFRDEDGNIQAPYTNYRSWEQLTFNLKFPLLLKERIKILGGYKQDVEYFRIKQLGVDQASAFETLERHPLKRAALNLLAVYATDDKHYVAFNVRYSNNGNYSGLVNTDSRSAVYQSTVLYASKAHEDSEWGIGLGVSSSFRRTSIIPIILINRNFSTHWGLEALLPSNIHLRYNASASSIFLAGVSYHSGSYLLDGERTAPQQSFNFNHSEVVASLQLEQQLQPWVWANFQVGYQYNFSTDFEAANINTEAFKVEPSNGAYLRLGIFLSPPSNKHMNR